MKELERSVRRYFESYSPDFLFVLKKVQQLTPPDWAKSGCFWLQHEFCFEDILPFCLTWHDGEGGHDVEPNDPIREIKTEPWNVSETLDFLEGDEVEDAVDSTICHWIRDCWVRSGGNFNPIPFHIHHYATNSPFSLRRGRFISQEELNFEIQSQ